MEEHVNVAEKYKKIKEKYPDDILLFQIGIFFRIMCEDAKKVSEILGLKLLIKGEVDNPMVYCGFPKSGLDKYIGKLVRLGFSVAVCSQIKSENGEVNREVKEVIRCLKT